MANCVVWLMYGRLVADYIIALPNGFGLVTAILQVRVRSYQPFRKPRSSPSVLSKRMRKVST